MICVMKIERIIRSFERNGITYTILVTGVIQVVVPSFHFPVLYFGTFNDAYNYLKRFGCLK